MIDRTPILALLVLASLPVSAATSASERSYSVSGFDRVRIAGRALSRWQRLLIGIALAVLALWLFANLVLRNVGAVSASAPTLEANLIALLPRIARLFGLPPPESVAELMAQLDVPQQETLMIGDTSHDMEMARAASVGGLAVTYGAHAEEGLRACQPLHCLSTVHQLREWLTANA